MADLGGRIRPGSDRKIEQKEASAASDPKKKQPAPPPMTIEVWGATSAASVYFEVLRDCDGDQMADRQGTENCCTI